MENQWKQGNIKAFKHFFNRHSKNLFTIACKHISSDDAEDIIQEIFIEIWEKKNVIKIKNTWESYLYAMLKYKIFRFIDQQNKADELIKNALKEIGDTNNFLDFETLYMMLDDTLSKLPKQTGLVIHKRFFENMKLREIAEDMGISTETVKTHLKRGMKLMRLQMKDALTSFFFL